MVSTLRSRVLGSLAAAALCATAPAQGKLWIVSDKPCPKVSFSQIQPAVDAAADGDVILVRGRETNDPYADFAIHNKSLTVAADGILPLNVEGISVLNLAPGKSVLLQGFQRFAPTQNATATGLSLQNNRGHVWIENWWVRRPGASYQINACDSVVFARCTLSGEVNYSRSTQRALDVRSSQVTFYDSTVSGGTGSTGIHCESGALFFAGSSVGGGWGYNGQNGTYSCTSGGPGGNGLYLGRSAQAYQLDTLIVGGGGGWGGVAVFGGYTCSFGSAGSAVVGPGTVVSLTGSARSFESTAPILEAETVPLTFTGNTGDVAALVVSAGQQHQLLPWLFGTFALAPPAIAPLIGTLPSQTLSTNLILTPGVVSPGEAVVLYTQGYFRDSAGTMRLGSPFAWVFLDENHDPLDGCDPARVIWVDDDAPNDPGPNNPNISDPLENGSPEHPFDAIQEAVDDAIDGNTVMVRDGTYNGTGNEHVVVQGLTLLLRSENGPQNCVIQSTPQGFGIDAEQGCDIEGLTVTGAKIGILTRGGVVLRDCVTRGCAGSGVFTAGFLRGTPARIERCVSDANAGFGIETHTDTVIDGCTVTNNQDSGIKAFNPLTLRNSLIAGNTATSGIPFPVGGGISMQGGTIDGCTIVGNSASGNGSGLYVGLDTCRVRSSIFWGNPGEQIHLRLRTLNIDFCDIEGGRAGIFGRPPIYGAGNLSVDPLFVSAATGDYHLQPTSPCIDAGDPSYVPAAGEKDIDGEARLQGAAVEIGADEVR